MSVARSILLSLLVVGFAAGAQAQAVRAPKTTQDFISVLKPAQPPVTAGVGGPGLRTRSFAPSTGAATAANATSPTAPAPGTKGSGVVPDLQILFEFNSAVLTQQARQRLDILGSALASDELRPFTFQIAGHTDAVGSADYNLDLSRRRAETVVQYLVDNWHIAASRLHAEGYGMTRLVVPSDGANARNRRVEVATVVAN